MITGALDLFGNRPVARQSGFDITLLPLNLSEGRNIGDLSGLFLSTAPRKSENSKANDIFIVLFYIDNANVSESRMQDWSDLLSETYYFARGSFTMGIAAAVKKFSEILAKQYKGKVLPTIFMNIAVLRGRSLMIAHAGPVHTTVISSDSVKNFNNDISLPIQIGNNELSYFTTDVHSEDLILLCPKVPNDWTNTAIMEVTGDSPLNAIRFLLDRSGGNLQAAVIQLKTGKGEITFRQKTTITANIQPEFEKKMEVEQGNSRRGISDRIGTNLDHDFFEPPASAKPLIRSRKGPKMFESSEENSVEPDVAEGKENNSEESVVEEQIQTEQHPSLTGENQLPGSEDLPIDFEAAPASKKKKIQYTEIPENQETTKTEKPVKKKKTASKNEQKSGFNTRRFLLILGCGLLIPLIVVSVLFLVYSGRSKNELHQEYLALAVETAQNAISEQDQREQESLWTDTLNYLDQALSYGTSPAATDLRRQAVSQIDRLNGGISTIYNYANNSKLPQGLNLTDIFSSGQYTYALDSTSGSVIRLVASGSGLTLDSGFSCTPGNYPEFGKSGSTVQVGKLIDFIMLPSGNPHSFVLAGIDANANVLYCSSFTSNQAASLIKPSTEKFVVAGITYANNSMFVLDTQASRVWEYLFSSSDGFVYEPSDYYGSYSPYLSDITDFAMYKEYAYFLKANGTMMLCDYTGYRPACETITEVESEDGNSKVVMSRHQFSHIVVNNSPDNSIYIMDSRLQSVLNLSVKGNYVRYIVPNRTSDDISQYSRATGFGITGQNRLLWAYKNDLYIANMP